MKGVPKKRKQPQTPFLVSFFYVRVYISVPRKMSGKASNTYAITYVPSTDVLTITWSNADFGSASFSGDHTSVTSDGMRSRFVVITDRKNDVKESVAFDKCSNVAEDTRADFVSNIVAQLATREVEVTFDAASLTGNVDIDGTLDVAGDTTLSTLTTTGTHTATNVNASGSVDVTGTLGVTGNTALSTLTTTGTTTCATMAVTTNQSIGGWLDVTGNTAMTTLTTTGTQTVVDVNASGSVDVTGTLDVTGDTTLTTLTTTGTQTVVDVNASGNVDVTGTLDVTGDTGVATLSADSLTLTHTNPSALSYFEAWTNPSIIGDIDSAGGGDPDSGIFDVGKLRILRINSFCIVNWEFRDNSSPKQGFFTAGFGDTNLEPGGANIVRIPTRFAPTVFQSNRQMADSATTSLWLYMYVTPTTFVVGQHNSAGAVTNWSGSQTPAGTFCYHLD